MVDANNSWSVDIAIKMARRLEGYEVYWLEEPVIADEIDGLAKVVALTDVPIAVGESEYTKYGFKQFIERKSVQIVQADATKCGGVTEFRKIAAIAEAWNLPVCPHADHYIHTPLVVAIPNSLFVEYHVDVFGAMGEKFFVDRLIRRNGEMEPSSRPGFVMVLNEKAIEELPNIMSEQAARQTMGTRPPSRGLPYL